MIKSITLIIIMLLSQPILGQDKNNLSNHELTIDFGSYRGRYFFPITELQYKSPIIGKSTFKFSGRLRSYGTLFFYSNSAYDITPIAHYYFSKAIKPVYFSVGIGLDTRVRLVNDIRSEAKTSAEPLFSLDFHGSHKKLTYSSSLWTRFYSNGISFAFFPQVSYKLGDTFSLMFKYELNYLTVFKFPSHELRHDFFIGTSILF